MSKTKPEAKKRKPAKRRPVAKMSVKSIRGFLNKKLRAQVKEMKATKALRRLVSRLA